jgi:hypothetical protein
MARGGVALFDEFRFEFFFSFLFFPEWRRVQFGLAGLGELCAHPLCSCTFLTVSHVLIFL